MNVGILYFNRGTGCYIRLLTSIFSLRHHYLGPVVLMQEGLLDSWMERLLDRLQVRVQHRPPSRDTVLLRKTSLWREMPFDRAMFLDADTIVQSSVDEFLGWVAESDYVATWFNGWTTQGPRMAKRIQQWEKVCPELVEPALRYGMAINTGVQGLSKVSTLLPAHEDLARRGDTAGCTPLMLDELAVQLLLPHHRHYLAPAVWNTSGKFGPVKQAKVIHYHGRKHCLNTAACEPWKQHYFELLGSYPESAAELTQSWGDRRFRKYFNALDGRRKDLTVVTAVNPPYAAKLKRNLNKWLALPGLGNQQFLVFVNGFSGPKERQFLNHPNVRVVRWHYSHSPGDQRETMLASFVFGVTKYVKTAYWMKLDADCSPRSNRWEWPDYQASTIVSHRWSYTKMKRDPAEGAHWFHRLDSVFSPGKPFFSAHYDPVADRRVSHRRGNRHGLPKRFASFCHIEATEFTRRIASHLQASNGGRLPIPSHDTTSWYCSQVWKEKVQLVNMKRWFKP